LAIPATKGCISEIPNEVVYLFSSTSGKMLLCFYGWMIIIGGMQAGSLSTVGTENKEARKVKELHNKQRRKDLAP
jgi:hypothetical protein